jgi:2-methylcitrate dehydratase PrpD
MSVSTTAGLTLGLAQRAASLDAAEIPDDVVELARQSLLDWFAVTLGGSHEDASRMLLEILPPAGDPGDERTATAVGHRVRLNVLDAALFNGTSSHRLDFDDVNVAFLGHASVAVLAAALALAEQIDSSVSELLTAYLAGYETTCRLAVGLGPEPYLRGFHATGTTGTIGAAAACARLLGLDPDGTAAALGIAASQAAGLKCNFGTMTKSLHAGKACQGGLLAALLAARGFTANPGAIEADQGFVAAYGGEDDTSAALEDPSSGWHLRDNLFKYHASCFFTHSTIEGLRELQNRSSFAPEDVEQITIHVTELELGTCVIPAPSTGLEVKFSLPHLSAMTVLGRSTASIDDADAVDADAVLLRSRVLMVPDGEPGAPTHVEVRLRDGGSLATARDVSKPNPDLDAQGKRLAEKFRNLAAPVLGDSGAATLLRSLTDLDGSHPVRELMLGSRPAG